MFLIFQVSLESSPLGDKNRLGSEGPIQDKEVERGVEEASVGVNHGQIMVAFVNAVVQRP